MTRSSGSFERLRRFFTAGPHARLCRASGSAYPCLGVPSPPHLPFKAAVRGAGSEHPTSAKNCSGKGKHATADKLLKHPDGLDHNTIQLTRLKWAGPFERAMFFAGAIPPGVSSSGRPAPGNATNRTVGGYAPALKCQWGAFRVGARRPIPLRGPLRLPHRSVWAHPMSARARAASASISGRVGHA